MVAEIFRSDPAPSSAARAIRAAASRAEAAVDAGLVDRFNAGDEAAFVEIVTRHRGKMFQVALQFLRNRADAEEIAQDTFIRAHRALARFRGDSSLSAWLHRITLNLARNRYWYFFRRRRHATMPLDAALSDENEATFAGFVASDAPGPVREVAASEFTAIVAGCMAKLGPGPREILTLRTINHHTYAQISRRLGVSVGTVKSRIARARVSLRVRLNADYPEFNPDASLFEWFEPLRSLGRPAAICA